MSKWVPKRKIVSGISELQASVGRPTTQQQIQQ